MLSVQAILDFEVDLDEHDMGDKPMKPERIQR